MGDVMTRKRRLKIKKRLMRSREKSFMNDGPHYVSDSEAMKVIKRNIEKYADILEYLKNH